MDDLISRKELLKDIKTGRNQGTLGKCAAEKLSKYVKAAPAVDAEPVRHGRWEYGSWENGHWVKGNDRCRCSACHRDFVVDNLNIWNGCPHCLAKMDLEASHET